MTHSTHRAGRSRHEQGGIRFGDVVVFVVGLFVAFSTTACTTTTPIGKNTLRNPRALALACRAGAGFTPIAECKADANVRAYIAGGSIGSIAIADPVNALWVDADLSVPGFTPRMVGDLPQAMVSDPNDGDLIYFGLGLKPRLGRMRLSDLSLAFVELDFVAAGIAASTASDGKTTLWVADPGGGQVWRVAAAAFEGAAAPAGTAVVVGGSPWSLATLPDGRVVVGHLNDDHVTLFNADGAGVVRIGLGPACADGIDNDGDGAIDRDDSGCDDQNDDHEGDAERGAACSDGVDNDGDGATDAVDAGCAATPTVDACRNGIDDDGDGFTDFPADPGCSGFAGASEALDAAACGDGIDNDGDGQTDFPADSDCASAADSGERSAVVAGVVTPCNDGVDNDGDGQTDFPADGDCLAANASGEQRPVCADGVDNDGDGDTDLADDACYNGTSPSETAGDNAPVAVVAATFDGRYVAIGHRGRRALYLLDTQKGALIVPTIADIGGAAGAYARPSRLNAKEGLRGLALPASALAMAPVRFAGHDGFALTLAMSGLVVVRLEIDVIGGAASVAVRIELVESGTEQATTAAKPGLTIEGVAIDIGDIPPSRYANPGLLTQGENSEGRTTWYGLLPSLQVNDHRNETWRLVFEGQVPGSHRRSGKMLRSDLLADSSANFCAMGVVPGDWLIVRRGAAAAVCKGWIGDVVRYRVAEVSPDRVRIDATSGVVDAPVRADNQLEVAPAPIPSVAPPHGCVPEVGVEYEIRAAGWLVLGARSGLLSSRPSVGGQCAPWDEADPLVASRIVTPQLASDVASSPGCPISDADLASSFVSPPYGGGPATKLTPFTNAVFSLQLRPGCVASDVPGEAARLLPSIRDATWRYGVRAGFTPRISPVGTAAYGVASGPGLSRAFVADQGAGVLSVVDIATGAVTQQLN